MNLITNADVKKFLTLVKAGMKNGRKRELKNYTSTTLTHYDGAGGNKEYFVSLEFHYFIDGNILDSLFIEEDFDVTNQINDLMGEK